MDLTDSPLAHRVVASPNFGERHHFTAPECLILHYTGMPTGAAALQRLCDPNAEVSCHYLIWEDGRIDQLAPEAKRAWHAGKSQWGDITDLNSASIGIEIVSAGHVAVHGVETPPAFPPAQIKAVIALCKDICTRHHIAPARVLAHSDIAPGRKIDPGELFPWAELAAHGVGHYVQPAPLKEGNLIAKGSIGPPVSALQSLLRDYGYSIEINGVYDDKCATVVAAFQRHFRPARVDGVADVSTVLTLRELSAKH